jgi:hypothetical protein
MAAFGFLSEHQSLVIFTLALYSDARATVVNGLQVGPAAHGSPMNDGGEWRLLQCSAGMH